MIAVPFWESVLGVFRMPGLTETLHSNREYWRKLKGVRETARKAKQDALADASTSAEAAGEGGAAGATEYSKSKTNPARKDSDKDENVECTTLYNALAEAGLYMRTEKMPCTEGYEDYKLAYGDSHTSTVS